VEYDTFVWVTGLMPTDGRLVLAKGHFHQDVHQRSLIFDAAAAEVGLLDNDKTWPKTNYEGIRTIDAGYQSNVHMREAMVARVGGPTSSKIVCDAINAHEWVPGDRPGTSYPWDRFTWARCNPWAFKANRPWTFIAFHGPQVEGAREGIDFKDGVGGIQSHALWYIEYAADDQHSHYTYGMSSQMLRVLDPTDSRLDQMRTMLNGGTPQYPPTLLEHTGLAAMAGGVWFIYPQNVKVATNVFYATIGALLVAWLAIVRQSGTCKRSCHATLELCALLPVLLLLLLDLLLLLWFAVLVPPLHKWVGPVPEFDDLPYSHDHAALGQEPYGVPVFLALATVLAAVIGCQCKRIRRATEASGLPTEEVSKKVSKEVLL